MIYMMTGQAFRELGAASMRVQRGLKILRRNGRFGHARSQQRWCASVSETWI